MTNGYPLELAPPIVELRQYLLRRRRREELIELFDREFVETQEALGIRVIGQFRDIDRPNHFVWLRGFRDHNSRGRALESFYGGPVWRKHGAAANATMVDSDDVHQVRAVTETGERLRIRRTNDRDADGNRGWILIVVSHGCCDDHDELMRGLLIPTVEQAGVRTRGLYATDATENPFPALPIRPSNVLVWIAGSDTVDTLDHAAQQISIARRRLADQTTVNGHDGVLLDMLRLEPTRRSCLNGGDVEDATDARRT
jgi:hypothetical protein